MSATASIQIVDTDTPALERIRGLVKRPKGVNAAAGKRVEKELRAHFLQKDREGNAKGWPRSHFWNRRIRQSTAFTGATDTGAEVTIAAPEIAQKIFGGTIRAKRGKFLAIPIDPMAKAAGSPREWDQPERLKPVKTRKGLFLVIVETRDQGGTKNMRLRPMYKLKASVTQAPDPTALPPENMLAGAIDDEAGKYFDREIVRNQAR